MSRIHPHKLTGFPTLCIFLCMARVWYVTSGAQSKELAQDFFSGQWSSTLQKLKGTGNRQWKGKSVEALDAYVCIINANRSYQASFAGYQDIWPRLGYISRGGDLFLFGWGDWRYQLVMTWPDQVQHWNQGKGSAPFPWVVQEFGARELVGLEQSYPRILFRTSFLITLQSFKTPWSAWWRWFVYGHRRLSTFMHTWTKCLHTVQPPVFAHSTTTYLCKQLYVLYCCLTLSNNCGPCCGSWGHFIQPVTPLYSS